MRRPKHKQLIVGIKPVIEAIQNQINIEKVFLDRRKGRGQLDEVMQHCQKHEIQFQFLPVEKMDYFYEGNHQGVIALRSLVQYHKLEDILSQVYDEGRVPLFVLLDGISDVGNFGAILRSCYYFNVDAVVLAEKGNSMISEEVYKASAGAVNYVSIARTNALSNTIEYLRQNGIYIGATVVKEGNLIYKTDMKVPLAIVMGSEEKGIRRSIIELCDGPVTIPGNENFDSLNVSVATGVVLSEVLRQRLESTN